MNQLFELRKTRNLSQAKVAKALKVAQNTYSYWESGKYQPDIQALNRLADFYQVSVDYLLGKTEDPTPSNIKNKDYINQVEKNVITLYRNANMQAQKIAEAALKIGQIKKAMPEHDSELSCALDNNRCIVIPVVGRSAAGVPIEMIENSADPLWLLDPKLQAGDFAVIACGDSMIEAGINDGDRVVFRPCPTVENGTIALVAVEGGSTIKKFFRISTGFKLVPANSAMEPMEYPRDADIRILGRFVLVINLVRVMV